MNKQSIEDMLEELSDLQISLAIEEITEKALKNRYKVLIKELKDFKKLMNQSIRERKHIEILIRRTKSKISTTPSRLRRWSKNNPDKVITKFVVGENDENY